VAAGDEVKSDTAPSTKFTYEDFLNFPNDGKRHEIIDGEHFVTPSPNTRHQSVSMSLTWALKACLETSHRGVLFAAPFDVVFSDLDVVEPDLLYISRERLDILTDQHVRGAPDLVVEILSPGTRKTDEMTKRKLYERFGVIEYWVVDTELEAIKVYRRSEPQSAFVRVAELSVERGDSLTTPVLPGFAVRLEKIFASPL
jgi:Uma2 family endonuclease